MVYLNKAIVAHKSNDLDLAESLYLKQLEINNGDQNANQLLGLVYYAKGNFKLAKSYMLRSLRANPNQVHVLVNLSSACSKLQLVDESIDYLRKAIDIDVNYLEAHINLARLYRLNKNFDKALSALRTSTQRFPTNVELLKEFASTCKALGLYKELVDKFKSADSHLNNNQEIKYEIALSLRKIGKSKESLTYYSQLESLGMKNFQLFHNIANSYSDIGNLDVAIHYYAMALNENLKYIESHINLNELLWEKGDFKLFLSSYVTALKEFPNDPDLNFNYIEGLIRTTNYQPAYNALKNLPKQLKNNEKYYLFYSRYLVNNGEKELALITLRNGYQPLSVSIEYELEYSKLLIEQDYVTDAIEILRNVLAKDGANQLAKAYIGTALELVDSTEASYFNNYNSLVKQYELSPPQGYDSIEEYCSELSAYLDSQHISNIQPLNQSLSNGTQTRGNLFEQGHSLIETLKAQLEKHIKSYNDDLPVEDSLNIITSAKSFEYAGSWSVKLKEDGYHSMHVHPMGWLSAVFYVNIPNDMAAAKNKSGWLKFGEPNLNLNKEYKSKYFVEPLLGKLVIFPSHMWHGTIPFKSSEYRTTIAFDVRKV